MKRFLTIALMLVISAASVCASPSPNRSHPILMLTREGVEKIKGSVNDAPIFEKSLTDLIAAADNSLKEEICVPVPKDGGGGYTHEMHKCNYYTLYNCGIAFQITGDRRYAVKVKELLMAYADLYPTLGYHPVKMSNVPGRLFWQTLNESVWLVHASIAYDCVYDFLTARERRMLEEKLFRPYARFVMEGTEDNRSNLAVFNRMHNHGTWADAAVGMIGIAMGDDELVDKALYGTDMTGRNGGFIKQLDWLFSPDGYFTEGAYYQRYAIWPFVLFSQCLDHYRPELDIFHHRDGILPKAVRTLIQLSYKGEFFHFNDALEKGLTAQELMYAADIMYAADPSDKSLLSIIRDYQGKVLVSDAGYMAAKDIAEGKAEPVKYQSMLLRDGRNGDEGAVALLRSPAAPEDCAVTFKATSHGLSHGHFDKLTIAYYDNGHEILSDYGAARFLNIEAKNKGHYTSENNSYAKQTIAHNTLVADESSHYDGNISKSSEHSPEVLAFDVSDSSFQYVSAIDTTAYDGVSMQRWLALASVPFIERPLLIDILEARSDKPHQYDYPVHYNGHMVSLNVPYQKSSDTMHALGTKAGYQHLWVEAEASGSPVTTTYTWLNGSRMYSLSTATSEDSHVCLLRLGANDPDFNLRSEPSYLIRESEKKNHIFASCLETHGSYDVQMEQSSNLTSSCKSVKIITDDNDSVVIRYEFVNDKAITVRAERRSGRMAISY